MVVSASDDYIFHYRGDVEETLINQSTKTDKDKILSSDRCWYMWNKTRRARNEGFESLVTADLNKL